jgi:cytochrome oxidase assembly protein ShyY1
VLQQLRQTRYLALAALMVIVAGVCIAAGTWQIYRLIEKHDANDRLRANAHQAVAPVGDVLLASPGGTQLKTGTQGQFRTVTATGTYQPDQGLLVREQTVNGTVGYLVLTPLRTGSATLLVVRGFIAADGDTQPTVPSPPAGVVTVSARVEPSASRPDHFGEHGTRQIRYLNVPDVASHLPDGATTPLYGGYVELLASAPGASGLTVIPDPDLSNPAGGAVEPQHLAYVVQWYLFALLALAAPFVMAWVDSRRGDDEPLRHREVVSALDDRPKPAEPDPDQRARDARLADRYGSARRS